MALAACHGPPAASAPPDVIANVQEIPLAPLPIEAPPVVKPPKTGSIVDDERPHTWDGARKNPGMASLRGVNEREAWVAFSVIGAPSYDAIVELETGCVTETFDAVSSSTLMRGVDGTSEQAILAALRSEDVQRDLGAHVARLARFAHNETSAVTVRRHADGQAAVSEDHRTIAVEVSGRVFVSLDGGRSFSRADGSLPASIDGVLLGGGDRYLLYRAYDRKRSKGQLVVVDLKSPLPAAGTVVDLDHFTALQVSSPEGLLLFSHESERCFYGVDPAAPVMKKLSCVPGPRTAKDHFFYVQLSPGGRVGVEIQGDFQATRGIVFTLDGSAKPRTLKGGFDLHGTSAGPDDEGRFAWETRLGVVRIDGPGGVHDAPFRKSLLGLDLQGNVLVFQQPPLVKKHEPMTMMPPAKGTLSDTRCSLVRRVTPK